MLHDLFFINFISAIEASLEPLHYILQKQAENTIARCNNTEASVLS